WDCCGRRGGAASTTPSASSTSWSGPVSEPLREPLAPLAPFVPFVADCGAAAWNHAVDWTAASSLLDDCDWADWADWAGWGAAGRRADCWRAGGCRRAGCCDGPTAKPLP